MLTILELRCPVTPQKTCSITSKKILWISPNLSNNSNIFFVVVVKRHAYPVWCRQRKKSTIIGTINWKNKKLKIDVDWSALSSHAINLVPKFAVIQMYFSPSTSHTATESDTNDFKNPELNQTSDLQIKMAKHQLFPQRISSLGHKIRSSRSDVFPNRCS